MSIDRAIRVGTSLAILAAAAAAAAPASAAKPKLYKISLSGDVRNEVTRTAEGVAFPPDGCDGLMSETYRYAASAGLAPKPSSVPVASYGRLRFRAQLKSPTASSTTETPGGSFPPSQSLPPDDPSVCTVAPTTKSGRCDFSAEATRSSGAEFALLPNGSKYELYYNRTTPILSCEDIFAEPLLDAGAPKLTNLRVNAVKRLAKGKTAAASGTATTPPRDDRAAGGETLTYTLKVKRVR